MDKKYNSYLIANAKNLRKNMTKEERHLWYDFLRNHPLKFRRQAPVGRYILDFFCPEIKLAIELDGSQHYETEENIEYDKQRTEYLNQFDIKIIRIQNTDVNKNFYSVCEYINKYISLL